MREIKFRGKHDGKWLYGFLDCNFKGAYTINEENKPYRMAVDKETIGQCTGKKDYIGREIYEGDIVKIDDDDESGVIGWDDERCMWGITQGNVETELGEYYPVDIEVIGNIYDNQELLGENDD